MAKHKHDAVIRAYLNGKTVQHKAGNVWYDIHPYTATGVFPSFRSDAEYRIKPKDIDYVVLKAPGGGLFVLTADEYKRSSEPRFMGWKVFHKFSKEAQ